MSLFDDIAHAIGHTVASLAASVGASIPELEGLVNDLAGNGIDVFSIGDRFGLSTIAFLQEMLSLLHGDPHAQLLDMLTGPFKPVNTLVEELNSQWGQMAQFHQETAQMLNLHISSVFQGDGTISYSGAAADTLWNTHQDYLSSLNDMVGHAQTQQSRYAMLGGHFGDYLSEAPGKVYGLSAPMAALAVLTLETSTPVLDEPIAQGTEQAIEDLWGDEEATPPSPISILIGALIIILVIFLGLVLLFYLIKDAVDSHNSQQKNTTVPPVKQKAVPTVTPGQNGQPVNLNKQQMQTAQELYKEFGGDIPLDEIEQMIEDHPQWTKEKLRQELLRKQLRDGKGYVSQLLGKTVKLSDGKTKTYSAADIEAMIKAGYTNTHFAVLLGLQPLSNAVTPQGRQLTWHALSDSIPRHGISLQEIDAAMDDPSRTYSLLDGGKAYIKSTKQGATLVITNSTGQIVTALKNLSPKALKQLGQNYNFNPNP